VTVHVEAAEVLPSDPGARTGPRVAVLVSLNFPDLTEPVAELVRRFTSTALAALAAVSVVALPSSAGPAVVNSKTFSLFVNKPFKNCAQAAGQTATAKATVTRGANTTP